MTDCSGPDEVVKDLAFSATQWQAATQSVSSVLRPLGLGMVAIAWIFVGSSNAGTPSPSAFLNGLHSNPLMFAAVVLAVLGLALDVLQYVLAALIWGCYHWALSQVLLNDKDASHSPPREVARGWLILRLTGADVLLARELGITEWSTRSKDWKRFRNDLRVKLTPRPTTLIEIQPAALNRFADITFWLKALTIITSYCLLLAYL